MLLTLAGLQGSCQSTQSLEPLRFWLFWFHVHLTNSGVTCTDFSMFNKSRKGVLGKSGVVLLTFLHELRWRVFDLVIVECVPQLDMNFVRKHIGSVYDIDAVVWGPEQAGWPCARPRLFLVMTAKAGKVALAKPLAVFTKMMARGELDDPIAKSVWWCAQQPDVEEALWQATPAFPKKALPTPCL